MIDRLEARLGGNGATVVEAERPTTGGDEPQPSESEDGSPETIWPEEPARAAMHVETDEPAAMRAATPSGTADEDEPALPSLDELVRRIPHEARELLDELFRAKFTAVRRVSPAALKDGGTKTRG